jgi:hypothetical protein
MVLLRQGTNDHEREMFVVRQSRLSAALHVKKERNHDASFDTSCNRLQIFVLPNFFVLMRP